MSSVKRRVLSGFIFWGLLQSTIIFAGKIDTGLKVDEKKIIIDSENACPYKRITLDELLAKSGCKKDSNGSTSASVIIAVIISQKNDGTRSVSWCDGWSLYEGLAKKLLHEGVFSEFSYDSLISLRKETDYIPVRSLYTIQRLKPVDGEEIYYDSKTGKSGPLIQFSGNGNQYYMEVEGGLAFEDMNSQPIKEVYFFKVTCDVKKSDTTYKLEQILNLSQASMFDHFFLFSSLLHCNFAKPEDRLYSIQNNINGYRNLDRPLLVGLYYFEKSKNLSVINQTDMNLEQFIGVYNYLSSIVYICAHEETRGKVIGILEDISKYVAPNSYEAWYASGFILELAGNHEKAGGYFEKIANLDFEDIKNNDDLVRLKGLACAHIVRPHVKNISSLASEAFIGVFNFINGCMSDIYYRENAIDLLHMKLLCYEHAHKENIKIDFSQELQDRALFVKYYLQSVKTRDCAYANNLDFIRLYLMYFEEKHENYSAVEVDKLVDRFSKDAPGKHIFDLIPKFCLENKKLDMALLFIGALRSRKEIVSLYGIQLSVFKMQIFMLQNKYESIREIFSCLKLIFFKYPHLFNLQEIEICELKLALKQSEILSLDEVNKNLQKINEIIKKEGFDESIQKPIILNLRIQFLFTNKKDINEAMFMDQYNKCVWCHYDFIKKYCFLEEKKWYYPLYNASLSELQAFKDSIISKKRKQGVDVDFVVNKKYKQYDKNN